MELLDSGRAFDLVHGNCNGRVLHDFFVPSVEFFGKVLVGHRIDIAGFAIKAFQNSLHELSTFVVGQLQDFNQLLRGSLAHD